MSDARIPTSTSVSESAVIEAPFSAVWHLVKLQDFSKFWSKLDKSEVVKSSSPETDVVKWTFKDGTVLDVKQEEHSVGLPLTTLPSSERGGGLCVAKKAETEHRPLHHLLGHLEPARPELHQRREHHPRIPCHVRQA
jgi:hypothetical protein